MYREFEETLKKWKNDGSKKPLMVLGARQIGKTYTITKFCQDNYSDFIYFNLEKDEWLKDIFEKTIDPKEILFNIEIRLEKKIDLEKTIFFFDEVQVSERFITSLKYFCEYPEKNNIICAGSLLGVKINRFNSSFPVGKVFIEKMYPLNFKEFLIATNHSNLLKEIELSYSLLKPMDNDLHEKALLLYKNYLIVGGLPEAVLNFINNNQDIMLFDRNIASSIVNMYINDMTKYTLSKNESIKIEKVYKSIPKHLAKENKKFQFKIVENDANKRKFASAIEWLMASQIILSCYLTNKIEIPLKTYIDEDYFKIYYSDVGILNSVSGILPKDIILNTNFMFKGAIAENYVACEFVNKNIPLIYWRSKADAKIDFLINNADGIIPIEVKTNDNNMSKRLRYYMEKYKPKYAIRISTKNFGFENNIKSIPLYAVFCINK